MLKRRKRAVGIAICVAVIGIFLFTAAAGASASDDEWDGEDKIKHATVSFGISILAYNFYLKNTDLSENQAKAAAFATTLGVGVIKELTDDHFSWKDMGANAVGAGIGIGISIEF